VDERQRCARRGCGHLRCLHLDGGYGRCAGQLAGALLGFDCSCLSLVDYTLNASVAAIPSRVQAAMIKAAVAASLLYPLAYEVAEALD
jgi:hypothetical protein